AASLGGLPGAGPGHAAADQGLYQRPTHARFGERLRHRPGPARTAQPQRRRPRPDRAAHVDTHSAVRDSDRRPVLRRSRVGHQDRPTDRSLRTDRAGRDGRV
ncbi:MAG: hypothetical protein AVDCRST_MAG64-3340, partial [uncultured Phycisphaerae bacterium]